MCFALALQTPKGFTLIARGCAYSRYPGYGHGVKTNPKGVASASKQSRPRGNPVGVETCFTPTWGSADTRNPRL